jgi:hypothetical protein
LLWAATGSSRDLAAEAGRWQAAAGSLTGAAMDSGQRFLRFLDNRRQTVLIVSLFLIVVGARAAVINYAGNPTPYADEWDGEAAGLLMPYLKGALTFRDLFHAHNEHVIFFTRLLTLAIFNVSGYWDVVLQMIANAILDAATVVAISYALSRPLRRGWAAAAMSLSAFVNAFPLSYDNILLGFNTHFYLLLAFSFASLWCMTDSRAWSPRWAAGALFALASFLCMASGALTLAAATLLHLLQMACGRRVGMREWLGIAALAATTVVLASLIPDVPPSDVYRAHSLRPFLSAVFQLVSWPASPNLGVLMAAPSVLFCLRTIGDRPALSDARWFNVAAFGWILTQFVAFAAGRALIPIETRYMDSLLIGLAVNMTSFFWLVESDAVARGKRRNWWFAALAAWLFIVAASLVRPAHPLPGSMEWRRQTAEVQEKNLRSYLATGDASYLDGARLFEIPYPDATRLRELLSAPEIRAALPPELLSREAPSNWVEGLKRTFLGQGYVWLGVGFLLFIGVLALGRARPTDSTMQALGADGGGEGPLEPPREFGKPSG